MFEGGLHSTVTPLCVQLAGDLNDYTTHKKGREMSMLAFNTS